MENQMLEIIEQQEGETCIALLVGRLDADTVLTFDEWSNRRNEGTLKRIIIDFTNLNYLSSAGLRAILTTNRHAERNSTELVCCGLAGMALQVFQTAGLLPYLTIYPSLKEALEAA